ncbi:Hydantoinase/oxoprolinase-domain-containing protein [Aspergillus spectabilis]
MGGTSTNVSRYAGSLEHVFESTTAGVSVQVSQLDINTAAAGGGSVLLWQKGILQVGHQSAGSHPWPACYRKGGPATITNANLVLGRILPEYFSSIFGPSQDQPLDVKASYGMIAALASEINCDQGTFLSVHEVANGFITVANETMCKPICGLTEAKGYPRQSWYAGPIQLWKRPVSEGDPSRPRRPTQPVKPYQIKHQAAL